MWRPELFRSWVEATIYSRGLAVVSATGKGGRHRLVMTRYMLWDRAVVIHVTSSFTIKAIYITRSLGFT